MPDIPCKPKTLVKMFVTIFFKTDDLSPVPGSQRSLTERQNVFDAIRKPPSVAMEKIQNSTAATLDRMANLQQRYRQHKEAMNSDSSDKSRRTSVTSTIDSSVSPRNPLTVQTFSCSVSVFPQSHNHLLIDPPCPLTTQITRTGKMPSAEEPIASLQCQPHHSVTPTMQITNKVLLLTRHRHKQLGQHNFDDPFQFPRVSPINQQGT